MSVVLIFFFNIGVFLLHFAIFVKDLFVFTLLLIFQPVSAEIHRVVIFRMSSMQFFPSSICTPFPEDFGDLLQFVNALAFYLSFR
jgi:hypothetical protein